MENPKTDKSETKSKQPIVIKNCADLQRLKLEKLMKNPEKPAFIPEPPREKGILPTPDFVRNVMGSSAGAGSGEFHVYRHLRRKEYARQKFIKEKSEVEKLNEEYQQKLEENKQKALEQTAKKRAKRLKKKNKAKEAKKLKLNNTSNDAPQPDCSDSDGNKSEEDSDLSKKESDDGNQNSSHSNKDSNSGNKDLYIKKSDTALKE